MAVANIGGVELYPTGVLHGLKAYKRIAQNEPVFLAGHYLVSSDWAHAEAGTPIFGQALHHAEDMQEIAVRVRGVCVFECIPNKFEPGMYPNNGVIVPEEQPDDHDIWHVEVNPFALHAKGELLHCEYREDEFQVHVLL